MKKFSELQIECGGITYRGQLRGYTPNLVRENLGWTEKPYGGRRDAGVMEHVHVVAEVWVYRGDGGYGLVGNQVVLTPSPYPEVSKWYVTKVVTEWGFTLLWDESEHLTIEGDTPFIHRDIGERLPFSSPYDVGRIIPE